MSAVDHFHLNAETHENSPKSICRDTEERRSYVLLHISNERGESENRFKMRRNALHAVELISATNDKTEYIGNMYQAH